MVQLMDLASDFGKIKRGIEEDNIQAPSLNSVDKSLDDSFGSWFFGVPAEAGS